MTALTTPTVSGTTSLTATPTATPASPVSATTTTPTATTTSKINQDKMYGVGGYDATMIGVGAAGIVGGAAVISLTVFALQKRNAWCLRFYS
jgi:hypothetical protein